MKAISKYMCIFVLLFCSLFTGNIIAEDIELSEIYSISPGLNPASHSNVKENIINGSFTYAKCGTSDFKQLYLNYNKLSRGARTKVLRKFFSRPTEYSEISDDFQYDKSEEVLDYELTSGHFRVHYTKTKSSRNNLVPSTDDNRNAVPDYVEKCASIFESVWIHEIDELGYEQPESDKGSGGNDKYDIYILNLDIRKWFGYTQPEGDIKNSNKATSSSFIVIDNDFSFDVYGFPDPFDALRITAAHEFFHAVQNSYDWLEEIWWCEASSVWMEEETYPDINGYVVFLKDFFDYPWIALDRSSAIVNPAPNHHYGAGVFPIFLADYFKDVNVIKYIWKKCADKRDLDKVQASEAIKNALKIYYAADMKDVFPFFAIYNYFTGINHNIFLHQGKYYQDGLYYPEVKPIYIYNTYPVNNKFPPYLKKPYNWGANYVIFNSENLDSNLKIVFESDGTNSSENVWKVNLIKLNNDGSETIEPLSISLNSAETIVRNFGSEYKKLILIPAVCTSDTTYRSYGYSYSAYYVDDDVSPGPVTNLKIISDGDSHVTLSWHNPKDIDFKGIKIVRNLSGQPSSHNDGDMLFKGFDSTAFNRLDSTFFYKDFLSNGAASYYSIFSYDEMENFSQAAPISIVMSDTTAPSKITTLNAEDDNSSGKVNLSWKGGSSADDIDHYNLYYKKSLSYQSISDAVLLTQVKNDSTFTASGLDNGTVYYFAVTAADEAGNENKEVEAFGVIPTLDIVSPSPVEFYIGPGAAPGSVKLDWNAYDESKEKDIIFYRIYRSKEPFTSVSSNLLFDSTQAGTKTYTFNGLNEDSIYYFAVTAIDEMNNEYTDISGKAWGFNKVTFYSPIFEKVKIYKNGNYAYKGQYIGMVEKKETLDIYLYPKKNFLTFISSKNSSCYSISDINAGEIYNISINKAVAVENIIFNSEVMLIDTKGLYVMPFVVDWDNDGNKDILIGDADGFVKLFKSPKSGDSGEFLKIFNNNMRVDGNAAPFVVDWDNDEKKDLLVGSSNGKVYLFKNTGTDILPEWSVPEALKDKDGIEIDVGNDAVPFIADWKFDDKFDNKKDIVIGNRDGKLAVYINKGADYKPILQMEKNFFLYDINNEKFNLSGFFIFNRWDDIETNDIIIGDVNGMIYYAKNNGNNVFSYQILGTSDGGNIDAGNYVHPFWVDWDNDNVMDLIAGNAEGKILFFKGNQFSKKSSGVHSSSTGPCLISNSLNSSSDSFLRKLKIIRDKYLFSNSAWKYIIEKYYQFTGEICP